MSNAQLIKPGERAWKKDVEVYRSMEQFFNELRSGKNVEISPENKRLIIKYALRTKKIDEIFTELTKEYCASSCPLGSDSCCGKSAREYREAKERKYNEINEHGLIEEMVELQEIEARKNGWVEPSKDNCKYHTDSSGCKLVFFKTPSCIGDLCWQLKKHLREQFGYEETESFLKKMYDIRYANTVTNPYLFNSMDDAIAAGMELVGINKSDKMVL